MVIFTLCFLITNKPFKSKYVDKSELHSSNDTGFFYASKKVYEMHTDKNLLCNLINCCPTMCVNKNNFNALLHRIEYIKEYKQPIRILYE